VFLPPPGRTPNFTSGWPNFAVSEAIRIVQAMAVSQPPPSAKPLIAAITGLPRFSTRLRTACPKLLDSSPFDGGEPGHLVDVGTGNECLVPRPRQDDTSHLVIVPRGFESSSQILPRFGI
jgi:hypothetical protein